MGNNQLVGGCVASRFAVILNIGICIAHIECIPKKKKVLAKKSQAENISSFRLVLSIHFIFLDFKIKQNERRVANGTRLIYNDFHCRIRLFIQKINLE